MLPVFLIGFCLASTAAQANCVVCRAASASCAGLHLCPANLPGAAVVSVLLVCRVRRWVCLQAAAVAIATAPWVSAFLPLPLSLRDHPQVRGTRTHTDAGGLQIHAKTLREQQVTVFLCMLCITVCACRESLTHSTPACPLTAAVALLTAAGPGFVCRWVCWCWWQQWAVPQAGQGPWGRQQQGCWWRTR